MARFQRITLLCLALAAWASAPRPAWADCYSDKNHYLRSAEGLAVHEKVHALNVQELMFRNARQHPEIYGDAFPYILPYAETHDRPKAQWDLLRILCSLYNTNLEITEGMAPERVREIQRIRDRAIGILDARESLMKKEALFRAGLIAEDGHPVSAKAAEIISKLKRLEKIADNVERVANPVSAEELGKVRMDPEFSFARYLSDDSMRDEAWRLLGHYERNRAHYLGHVRHLPLIHVDNPHAAPIVERILGRAKSNVKAAEVDLNLFEASRKRSPSACPKGFAQLLHGEATTLAPKLK